MADEIKQRIADWEYMRELPVEYEGFSLVNERRDDKSVLGIFGYVCESKRRRLECFYNKATGDFMMRRIFGLNEYNDMDFITPKLEVFEQVMRSKFFLAVQEMSSFENIKQSMMIERKGIKEHNFGSLLPAELHGFELYIAPKTPVRLISGSYIVVDYSDFDKEEQFVVYYNELKGMFYAEKKIRGVIETTSCMDAVNIRDLEKNLALLPELLQNFASKF